MALFDSRPARLLLVLAGLPIFAITMLGQQDQQVPTYSSGVNVVNVLATVRDKHGKIVNNLAQGDFVLEEDGRPQTIRYFAHETDLPLTLGLLVDTSRSLREALQKERSDSSAFVDQVVRESRDSAFLIHFDREVELLQDLTPSHKKLETAIGQLESTTAQPEDPQQPGGGSSGGGGGYPGGGQRRGGHGQDAERHDHGGSLLYDAVFLSSDELMKKQQGRKSIVVLSDGLDRGSKTSLDAAIESAQRSNTIVYSIYFAPEQGGRDGREGGDRHVGITPPWGRPGGGYPGGGGGGQRRPEPEQAHVDGRKILERISKETGGRMFEVSKKQTIAQIYQQIQDELRNQYNLGYTPDRKDEGTNDYHKIGLTTKQKDLVVQARDGYYSVPPTEAKERN